MADHGLDGPESNTGGDEIFRASRPALGPTQPPVQWVTGLSRGKVRPGCGADPPHPSIAEGPRKSRAIILLNLKPCVAYKKNENLPTDRPTLDSAKLRPYKSNETPT